MLFCAESATTGAKLLCMENKSLLKSFKFKKVYPTGSQVRAVVLFCAESATTGAKLLLMENKSFLKRFKFKKVYTTGSQVRAVVLLAPKVQRQAQFPITRSTKPF
ncbi:hypothetical protein D1B33_04025 [Lysinibacillus yapensis]|uniref:Uncharacterized protein n=1 Tax=Ureibacillus yapensis TaxID=2304605 RepID=A0A396SFG1_9BACL|nr:hypothetical protein D1B33_04025 [Lysinibacillus yapensis]